MSDSRRNSYKKNGSNGNTPFLIGVSGGTASGKVSLLFILLEI